jgi:hypothetical protein
MSETIITIQFPSGDDTANQRVISVLPRNARSEQFDTEFVQGKLAVSTTSAAPEKSEVSLAQSRAEDFIRRFLQDGSKFETVVEDAQKWEDFGKNAFRAAASHLRKQGVLTMTRNSRHQSIWTLQAADGMTQPTADEKAVQSVIDTNTHTHMVAEEGSR